MKISTATAYSAGLQTAGPPRRGGVDEARPRGAGSASQPDTPAGPKPIQMSGAGRFDMLVYTGVPMKLEVVGNAAAAAVQDELNRDAARGAAHDDHADATEPAPADEAPVKAKRAEGAEDDGPPPTTRSIDIAV